MSILNTETLDQLIEAIGRDAVLEIKDAMAASLADLREQMPQLSHEQMGRRAHSLKGSTSYLGTEELYAAAERVDAANKRGEFAALRTALEELDQLVSPTIQALESYFQGA